MSAVPSISVIIPCYNAELYLEQTVESVLKQSYRSFETIIVDDGSTDRSKDIIRAFGSSVHPVFESHQGASVTRNKGTKLARGKYFQYLDADDLLEPDALESRVDALERSVADVAYSDWQKLRQTPQGFERAEVMSDRMEKVHSDPVIAAFTSFWAPPAAITYRREIVEKIGGWNESLPIIQDARFFLDSALKGARFIHVSGVKALYRVHENQSLSSRNSLEFTQDVFSNARQIQEIWESKGELTSEERKALISVYEHAARNLFQLGSSDFDLVMQRLRVLERGFQWRYSFLAQFLKSIVGPALARKTMSILTGIRS